MNNFFCIDFSHSFRFSMIALHAIVMLTSYHTALLVMLCKSLPHIFCCSFINISVQLPSLQMCNNSKRIKNSQWHESRTIYTFVYKSKVRLDELVRRAQCTYTHTYIRYYTGLVMHTYTSMRIYYTHVVPYQRQRQYRDTTQHRITLTVVCVMYVSALCKLNRYFAVKSIFDESLQSTKFDMPKTAIVTALEKLLARTNGKCDKDSE